jgi:ankyrin repeat protein
MDRRIVDLVNKSDIKKLQCLLATGTKLQLARDNNGCNLLHLAVFSRQVESIKWIVENLPELLIKKNLAGRTPLHSACKPIFGLDIIRPLVKNGQALEIGDDDAQRTPLHYGKY